MSVPNSIYTRNFALSFVSNLCFVMTNAMLVHFARYVSFLGGDERDIGWIMGTGAVAALVLRPRIGRMIDRLGARTVWAIGNVAFAGAVLLLIHVRDIGPEIYLLRMLAALAPALIFTSTLAYLTHTISPERLAEGVGSFGASGFLGIAFGPWIGDRILAAPGEMRTHDEFTSLFVVAACMLTAGLLILPFLKSDPPHPDGRAAPFLASVKQYWPGPVLLVCVVFGACMTVTFVYITKYADRMAIHNIGLMYYTTYGVVAFVSRVIFRKLPERLGRTRLMRLGMAMMALGMISFWIANDARWMIVPAVLCGLAHSWVFHPMVTLVVSKFPQELRGTGSATALIAIELGQVVGGPVLGTIAYYDYHLMFSVVALACAVSIFLIPAKRVVPVSLPTLDVKS